MSTLKVDNIQNRVGSGAPTLTYGATIPSGQDLTVGGNLSVTGNLTVSGTTTTVDTANTTIKDSLIELNNGATGNNSNDLGLIFERGDDVNVAFIWDESADKFALGTTSSVGSATGNLTLSTGTLVANLEGSQSGGSVSATTITGSSDLAINTSTLFVDVSELAVGVLTNAPGFPATLGTSNNTKANAAFDIAYSGSGPTNGVPNITMLLGADTGAGGTTSRTNSTDKEFRIASPARTETNLPVLFAMAHNTSTENRIYIGHGTGSCATPTEIYFKVNNATNVTSSTGESQLLLKGLTATSGGSTQLARLELKNSGFSESCNGQFNTSASGTVAIDCSQGTTFARQITGNVTQFALTNVDAGQNRVQTVTIFCFVATGSDFTVAESSGVSINGATAQNIRFSGGGNQTLKNSKINMVTLVVHTDSGSNTRVFGTLVDNL